jgi:hypothetical protein
MNAVSRKPKPREQADEAEIIALVHQGGSIAQSPAVSDEIEKMRVVNLRLPEEMLAEVDALLKQRRVRVSRNTWFLEAIVEKAQRERG